MSSYPGRPARPSIWRMSSGEMSTSPSSGSWYFVSRMTTHRAGRLTPHASVEVEKSS